MANKSTLDAINEALQEVFDYPIYYGTASNIDKTQPWNYIVFSRENISANANLTSYVHHYNVAIIHEDFIPEDMFYKTIDTILSIPGMKFEGEVIFDYMAKPGTTNVVELMVVRFYKAEKRPCQDHL